MKLLGKLKEAIAIIFRGTNRTVTLDPDAGTPSGTNDITINLAQDLDADAEMVTNKGTQVLQGKELADASDATKKVGFDYTSQNTGRKTTIQVTASSADRTVVLPDADDTLVGRNTTEDLQNKTIDADLNSISNLADANIKSGASIAVEKINSSAANEVIVSSGSGDLTNSGVSTTSLGYLDATSSIQTQIDSKLNAAEKGAASGVAPLDGSSKVPVANLPDSVLGALQYQSTWNADTNTPALSDGSGTEGHYYIVSVAGTTSLDGESDWEVGDWVVANDMTWEKIDNSDKVSSVAGKTGVVTLDLNDVDNGGALNTPNISESVLLDEQGSTPSNPVATKKKFYAKSDGKLYTLDSSGIESEVGSGSGGSGSGVNLVSDPNLVGPLDGDNPNDIGDWVLEGSSGPVTVGKITNPSEIPLNTIYDAALRIQTGDAPASGYYRYRFEVPPAVRNMKLSMFWYQQAAAGYAGSAKISIYKFSDLFITGTRVPLSSDDTNEDTRIRNLTGLVNPITFDTDDSQYYEIRVERADSVDGEVFLNDLTITPDPSTVSGPASTNFQEYDLVIGAPTTAPTPATSSTSTAIWKRSNDMLTIMYNYANNGSTTGGSDGSGGGYYFPIPDGITIDLEKLNDDADSSAKMVVGNAQVRSGSAILDGAVRVVDSQNVVLQVSNDTTSSSTVGSGSNSITSSGTLRYSFTAQMPITEWSAGAQYGSNDVTYVSHDGTDIVYGSQGSAFETDTPVGTRVDYDLTSVNISTSDKVSLEVQRDGGFWAPLPTLGIDSAMTDPNSTNTVGFGIFQESGTGKLLISRGKYRNLDNGLWSSVSDRRWRLRIEKAGAASGFGLATATNSGLVKNYEELSETLAGDFSGGTLKGTRVGNMVTLTTYSATWTDDNNLLSQSAILPESMRPLFDVSNIVHNETDRVVKLVALADGRIKVEVYRGEYSNHTAGESSISDFAASGTDNGDVDTRNYTISYSL